MRRAVSGSRAAGGSLRIAGGGLRGAGHGSRAADSGARTAGRVLQLCDPGCHTGVVHRMPSAPGPRIDGSVQALLEERRDRGMILEDGHMVFQQRRPK